MDPRTSAQDVIRCDLCETAIVQMHCDTCLINLCKACVGEHISTDESKDHKVVKFQSRKSTPLYPGCSSHEKERSEMYCRHCDAPVCPTCLASDQHLGHKLSKILHILGEKKDLIKKELTELNETIYPTYQGIAADVQNRISQLEKEYGDLSLAITKHAENLHREIDKIVIQLKTEVDKMKTSQLQTLQKHLDEINSKIADIKDEIDSLEIPVDSNDISSLISLRSSVDQYTKLPQKLVPSVPKFTPRKIQRGELCTQFGALSSSSITSSDHGYPFLFSPQFVKKLLDAHKIFSTKISERFIYMKNIACQGTEKIWTSGDSNSMTLYNISQGLPLKSISTKSGNNPTDIALTRSGDLIYTDNKDRTVNIVKNEKIKEVIRLQNWRPRGISCTSSGDLLVTLENDDNKQSKVVRYSGSTEKQSIQFDDKGKSLYSSGGSHKYICENRNFDICVADNGADAIVVVNKVGKLKFRYNVHTRAQKNIPFSPEGITTDSQSHILTIDFDNCCVHIIDKDGHFLHYINCRPLKPYWLCTDADDNLFLAVRDSHSQSFLSYVKKIKYLR